ncbi:major facilitator superfamily transporter [Aaosphaeria arxii CBS 175.79]|uniref:Major facilitator superfamily transporter n=1 Tax=Aaosphaeria arxii CBS 175.79 TaxID=1450172 RepID=A0A6A5XZJ2_9PLEO|nr:major facilitator superfamily transporter [Aaosphaeria arxii CBS 175.79]KAF2017694.1 major facilitator superfamily transporter [Aaosphaeria arxii CBS 175.79]
MAIHNAHGGPVEKEAVGMTEDVERSPTNISHDTGFESEFTPKEQRAIIHRIDRRLVVTVGVLYCISLMDRTNLSAAAIAGMTKELKLEVLMGTVSRYSVVTLVFFTTYIVFQPPATILVRKLGPRNFLSAIVVAWGAVMIGMGFVHDWQSLAALRIVLGILEAGFFPSCVYLLSTWYTRYDVGKRYSVFYILGSLASACAGILAYGLMQMHGLQGMAGWRWIFAIEGALTCALGIAGYWLLVDFPDKAHKSWKFLSEREARFIIERVDRDRGDAKPEPFSSAKFFRAGTDPKIWVYAMIFFNTTTVTYALAYFLPIILTRNMGFDVGTSQCLVAPPYALAAIVMYTTGYLGDKYKIRGPIIIFNMVLCLIGLPIMGFAKSPAVRYFGVFLTTAGANSNVPAAMAYQANNIRGQWKRAFCSATLVGFGGVGGIAGGLVFRVQDAPHYRPGLYACIACCLLSIVLVIITSFVFKRQNARADRGEVELEHTDEDQQRGFRYTI